MSMPTFPNPAHMPTREQVINQIISSIAMEELGLSHIINAEGEKIQYALGTIPGISGPEGPLTLDELFELNKSVHKTLDSAMMNQFFLRDKLTNALSASTMQGPTGAVGTILGSYDTLEELETAHKTGQQGDAYLVAGALYVWDTENEAWLSTGNLIGPTGPQGLAGPISTILGSYDTYDQLVNAHPTGTLGDLWIAGSEVYSWVVDPGAWESMGYFQGPTGATGVGETGAAGATGATGATGGVGYILDSFDTLNDLMTAHTTGVQGDAYLVGDGDLYVWKANGSAWEWVGNVQGPIGHTGATGTPGDRGERGLTGLQGPTGPAGTGGVIQNIYADYATLKAEHDTGQAGDLYLVGTAPDYHLYFWNAELLPPDWDDAGAFVAVQGPAGPAGAPGADSQILGSFDTIEDLRDAHATGNPGESYLIGLGELYTWIDNAPGDWQRVGNLLGPTGSFSVDDALFSVNGPSNTVEINYGGNLRFASSSLGITVNPATATVTIEDASVTVQDKIIQFSSLDSLTLQTDGLGQHAAIMAVGQGYTQGLDTNMDPIRIPGTQIIPIKIFADSVLTELHASLATEGTIHSDIPLTLYAQLFAAPTLVASEFYPVENTLFNLGVMSTGTPIGALFTDELTDLSIPLAANTQYVLGFYCTANALLSRQEVYLGGWMKIQ